MRRSHLLLGMSTASVSLAAYVAVASADPPPAPPKGWEAAPAPSAPRFSEHDTSKYPSQCGKNGTCFLAQTQTDHAEVMHPVKSFDLRVEDLPKAVVRHSGDAGFGDAPRLRIIDGRGGPPPWKDGPYVEVRAVPPGDYGDITFGDQHELFFSDYERRGLFYGVSHDAGDPTFVRATTFTFEAISKGGEGVVTFDAEEGTTDQELTPTAKVWTHASGVPIADGLLHAFTATDKDGQVIRIVRDMEIMTLRSQPGASETANISIREDELAHVAQSSGKSVALGRWQVLLDVTHPTTEASAVLHVRVFRERPFAFFF